MLLGSRSCDIARLARGMSFASDAGMHPRALLPPSCCLRWLGVKPGVPSPLVGRAVDGFPIFALCGLEGSAVVEQTSGYRLRSGARLAGDGAPGGTYDGTFVADYEYVEGLGSLGRCNGRVGVTPERAGGGYAYLLTREFPAIPRCFIGTPDPSFAKRRLPPPR